MLSSVQNANKLLEIKKKAKNWKGNIFLLLYEHMPRSFLEYCFKKRAELREGAEKGSMNDLGHGIAASGGGNGWVSS